MHICKLFFSSAFCVPSCLRLSEHQTNTRKNNRIPRVTWL